jgi:DNA-binding transcriptional LysR family regulator
MTRLIRKIDLTSLRLFVAVCQEGNIARAAARECIAPSAVSRRVAEIEAAIGLPVIDRDARPIGVTAPGRAVFKHAQAIIGMIESLSAELSEFHSGAKGEVRLVANLGSILQFLPEDMAAFRRIFPEVRVMVEEQSSVEVLHTIEERGADIGICNAIDGMENVDQKAYRQDNLAVIVPRHHQLASASELSFRDVASEEFISPWYESTLSKQLVSAARDMNAELKITVRMNSVDAICRMVQVGLGISIVPAQIGELYKDTLDISVIPLTDAWAQRDLIIVYRKNNELSAAAKALVEFLSAPL